MTTMLRRAVLAGLAALTATALAAGPAGAQSAPSPWLQADYDGAGSAANLAESTLTPGTVGQADALRTFRSTGQDCFGEGRRGRVTAPLLSESRVYAFNGKSLVAYASGTGRTLWSTGLGSPNYDDHVLLAAAYGFVLIGTEDCGTHDPVSHVDAYRAIDGTLAYSLALPVQDGLTDAHVSGSYVAVATNEAESRNYELSVYRLQDGSRVWTRSTGEDNLGATSSVIVAGKVFAPVAQADGTQMLTAFDLATGAQLYAGQAGDHVYRGDGAGPDGSHLYVGIAGPGVGDGRIYDVDPATGRHRFLLRGAQDVYAVDGSQVYAMCADSAAVCTYDRQTGARLRSYPVKKYLDTVFVAGGVLYIGDSGVGYALDGSTSRMLVRLPGEPVTVGQGRIATLNSNGSLTLYGLPGS